MNIFSTPLNEALIYSLCVYGVYLLFRQLRFPDISTDNVFSFGSISFVFFFISNDSLILSILLVFLSGFLVGAFTSLLYSKFKIPKLLCGVITYSILFSINLKFFNKPNVSMPSRISSEESIVLIVIINVVLIVFMSILLKSKLGKSINTIGNNPAILKEFRAPSTWVLLIGCGIANALIAVSGALTSVHFGFSDVSIGVGLLINSVAAIIISENLMIYFPKRYHIFLIPVGVFIYHLLLFMVITYLSFGLLDYTDYKLISGVIIILFFLTSYKRAKDIISF